MLSKKRMEIAPTVMTKVAPPRQTSRGDTSYENRRPESGKITARRKPCAALGLLFSLEMRQRLGLQKRNEERVQSRSRSTIRNKKLAETGLEAEKKREVAVREAVRIVIDVVGRGRGTEDDYRDHARCFRSSDTQDNRTVGF
jgi:hypothetical protein